MHLILIQIFATPTTPMEMLIAYVKLMWAFTPWPCCGLLILVPIAIYQSNRRNGGPDMWGGG